MDPSLSPPGSAQLLPCAVVIFEGYLHKMPPLDKIQLFANWKKRYFVLSRTNPFDSSSVELAYYSDSEKRNKKGTIDLSEVKNVNPVHKSAKEHVFSLEGSGKVHLLKSADAVKKNLWVAKLLECCAKDHLTYHVTIPSQPMCNYIEGIIKLAAPSQVTIVSPANGAQILAIPFDKIRRFGCEVIVDYDIVWFEMCGCKGTIEQFLYLSVPSGIEIANVIVHDIKKSIELTVRSFLIQEEGEKERCQTTYISRTHYGCGEFPSSMRQAILQNGLISLATSQSRTNSTIQMSRIDRMRRVSDFGGIPTPGAGAEQRRQSIEARRNTLAELHSNPSAQLTPSILPTSPRCSPSPTQTPNTSGRMTLAQFGTRPAGSYVNSKAGNGLSNSAGRGDFDSGVNLEGFDPARHSAPSFYTVTDVEKETKKQDMLTDMHSKMRSLDGMGKKRQLQKQKRTGGTSLKTLGELKSPPQIGEGKRRLSDFGRDSANGSVGDLIEEEEPGTGYSHLEPMKGDYSSKSLPGRSKKSQGISLSAYDHLNSSHGGMSLKAAVDQSKKGGYVMS